MSTAAQALTEFHNTAEGRVIGYCCAPETATWFALDTAGTARGPGGPIDLSAVFEIYATDGSRELRWLQGTAGSGSSAVLADNPQPVSLPSAVCQKQTLSYGSLRSISLPIR